MTAGRVRERIDMAVFGFAPSFRRASLRLRPGQVLSAQIRAYLERLAASANLEAKAVDIAAWRSLYAAAGFPPSTVSPPEALAAWRRVPGGVPSQGPVLDLVNAFSIQHGVPAAAYSLEAVEGDLWLRPSRGIEHYVGLDGLRESPPVGEMILVDSADQVFARHWHGSPSRAGLATEGGEVLVHLDTLGPEDAADTAALAEAFGRLASAFLGAAPEVQYLGRRRPVIAWD